MGQRSKAGSNWCVILVVMVGLVLAACGSGAEPSGSVSGEPPATAEPPATTEPPDTSTTPFQSEGSQSNPMRLDSPFPYLFDVVGGQVDDTASYYKVSLFELNDGYLSFALLGYDSLEFDVYRGGLPPEGKLFCTSRGNDTLFGQCSGYTSKFLDDYYIRVEYDGHLGGTEYVMYVGYETAAYAIVVEAALELLEYLPLWFLYWCVDPAGMISGTPPEHRCGF